MTAADIRSLNFSDGGFDSPDKCNTFFALYQAQMLREIAAQLAELNEFLRNDESSFAVTLCASNHSIPVVIRDR